MQTQTRFNRLNLEDLSSMASFSSWIRENITHYFDGEIPPEHLLIYLDYVEQVVRATEEVDKRYWIKSINELRNRINAVEKIQE